MRISKDKNLMKSLLKFKSYRINVKHRNNKHTIPENLGVPIETNKPHPKQKQVHLDK